MEGLGAVIYVVVIYTFLIILFVGSWILATVITGYLHITGISWWLVNIVITLIIFSLIGNGTTKIHKINETGD